MHVGDVLAYFSTFHLQKEENSSMNASNYAQLILDVSDFLGQRPMDEVKLSSQEMHMLTLALEFLRRVLAGHKLLTDQNDLLPSLGTINAYTFADQAIR